MRTIFSALWFKSLENVQNGKILQNRSNAARFIGALEQLCFRLFYLVSGFLLPRIVAAVNDTNRK